MGSPTGTLAARRRSTLSRVTRSVARAQRDAAATAGGQPALEAGAIDLQRTRGIIGGRHGHQVARADQRIDTGPVATEEPGRLGHRHRVFDIRWR
jgi:hypothetical protein